MSRKIKKWITRIEKGYSESELLCITAIPEPIVKTYEDAVESILGRVAQKQPPVEF